MRHNGYVTKAQAELLLLMARYEQAGQQIPPDEILALELECSPRAVNNRRLGLETAGILDGDAGTCWLASRITKDPQAAHMAIFVRKACGRTPGNRLSRKKLAAEIRQQLGIHPFDAGLLVGDLIVGDYLQHCQRKCIMPGPGVIREGEYLRLLAASKEPCPAA